ncbi:MAG: phosphoribosylformylglycinamidine cyclo-ligase [Candidatus Methanofastidiosia archaeon]
MDYAASGVDIKKEEKTISSITKYIRETLNLRKGKIGAPLIDIGHFSGLVDLGDKALAISTDGVGTKILVAKELNRFDTIGIDLIAMNVNDIICIGATPIALVDTISIQKPNSKLMAEIGKGLLEGAKQANVCIVGGETATIPDILRGDGDGLDLVGTAIGLVNKDAIITGKSIEAGNIVLGIESSGIHSNGLTLARKIMPKKFYPLLLEPTRIYVNQILALLETIKPMGMAHITGTGLLNLKRLKKGIGFDLEMPEPPPVFNTIQQYAKTSDEEMYRTFNMGIGLAVVVKREDVSNALNALNIYFPTRILGEITDTEIIKARLHNGRTINL